MSFYNTTNEIGEELRKARKKASSQDRKVLKYFRENYISSPSRVWAQLGMDSVLLTSVRRSISNLTRDGFLTKTRMKWIGYYGRKEYVWQYNGEQ